MVSGAEVTPRPGRIRESALATATPGDRAHGAGWLLLALLAFAFGVRVIAAIAFPSIHHPDEVFQLFEPAHRLAFGWGVNTWEFVDGIRSLVPPTALAAVMSASEPLVGGPTGYIDAVRIALTLLSLIPVAAVWYAGRRESFTHGVLSGLVAACWFEIVYFSFRPLTEALACDFILTALALASPADRNLSSRTLAGIGLCLALTVLLRLQLAPGVALIAFAVGRLDIRRRWAPMALGAIPALAVFGVADWLTWGVPFASYFRSVAVNLGAGKASVYGVQSWSWYLVVVSAIWGPFLVAAIVLCAVRWRRSWLWIGFAAVELVVHSAIPHKEYRFIYPALAALVIAAALGSADLLVLLRSRLPAVRPGVGIGATAVLWLIASATLSAAPEFRPQWFYSSGALESEAWLSGRSDICGVLFYDLVWTETGGYAFLHRRVPLYFPVYAMNLGAGNQLLWPPDLAARLSRARSAAGAYDYVVLKPGSVAIFQPKFTLMGCFGVGTERACVAERPGGCAPDPGLIPILAVPRLGEPTTRP
jgi:hypothetical protein